MRLFIAINFDDNLLEALTDFQDDLRVQGVTGNYTSRENLHITLAFIGDYGNPDEVLDAMEQVTFEPLEIRLDGVGHFGDLFWVGLAENPALAAYVKRLRRELAARGIPFDKKRFSPHITLIRKASYRGGRLIPVEEAPTGVMTATRVSLMKSERGKRGMIYTEIGGIGEDGH
ncbi:MAG: RNA 2',3'-cyclic phosphodiesterase [Lachnospiraceae bacterium]|nr:RNA 2',3'-cyclic phosphodiesterase [Lachnospiraceae bacterium]